MSNDNPSLSSTEAALRERVKELTCLYGIALIAANNDTSLDEVLHGIVELLPPAWQYPNITSARIVLDNHEYMTEGFSETFERQSSDLLVSDSCRGAVDVVYSEKKPTLDEGSFLKEERSLIDAVARQVALLVERREANEEGLKLQGQLRHADRLATVGVLAAGIAHELNEPLGNILGFAQLMKKSKRLPVQEKGDVEKIEGASLHAREIIKKLLIFARQMPSQETRVNLNQVVEDGLSFLEPQLTKNDIELVRVLSPDLPEITADAGQINQILVNLTVNASQAMVKGGRVTIETHTREDSVVLVVTDTGAGMDKDVMERIYVPFFTTKDVGHGTGLGLAVVHGIVTSHGGFVNVESKVGEGTRFEVRLPLSDEQDATKGDRNALSK